MFRENPWTVRLSCVYSAKRRDAGRPGIGMCFLWWHWWPLCACSLYRALVFRFPSRGLILVLSPEPLSAQTSVGSEDAEGLVPHGSAWGLAGGHRRGASRPGLRMLRVPCSLWGRG